MPFTNEQVNDADMNDDKRAALLADVLNLFERGVIALEALAKQRKADSDRIVMRP